VGLGWRHPSEGSHTTNVINIADHVRSDLPTGYYLLTVVATIDGAHVWAEEWVWIRLTGAGSAMILEEIVDVEISVETAMILEKMIAGLELYDHFLGF